MRGGNMNTIIGLASSAVNSAWGLKRYLTGGKQVLTAYKIRKSEIIKEKIVSFDNEIASLEELLKKLVCIKKTIQDQLDFKVDLEDTQRIKLKEGAQNIVSQIAIVLCRIDTRKSVVASFNSNFMEIRDNRTDSLNKVDDLYWRCIVCLENLRRDERLEANKMRMTSSHIHWRDLQEMDKVYI